MVDNTITDRSYLFGRLMALTQQLERRIPPLADEGRTMIDRNWSRIIKNPKTWVDTHAQVLSSRLEGDYKIKEAIENEITYIISELFIDSDFLSSEALSPAHNLGFSQQLMSMKFKGGYRDNPGGRPSTGRKKRQVYVTDQEYEQIKELIESLRK